MLKVSKMIAGPGASRFIQVVGIAFVYITEGLDDHSGVRHWSGRLQPMARVVPLDDIDFSDMSQALLILSFHGEIRRQGEEAESSIGPPTGCTSGSWDASGRCRRENGQTTILRE